MKYLLVLEMMNFSHIFCKFSVWKLQYADLFSGCQEDEAYSQISCRLDDKLGNKYRHWNWRQMFISS
jgi:hypothetical protein